MAGDCMVSAALTTPRTVGTDGGYTDYTRVRACLAGQPTLEIGDRAVEPIVQRDGGLPAEGLLGQRDVRAPLLRIGLRQWLEGDLRFRSGLGDDLFRQLEHGEFAGVADIEGARHLV